MELTMLGTGHATVTECYNTCFVLSYHEKVFLVDAGGGNEILRILKKERISLGSIHDIFISHGHTDHVLGSIWVIRMIGQLICSHKYEGELNIYCHKELKEIIVNICRMTLAEKITALFEDQIRFIVVEDGDQKEILGMQVRFFDIRSTKMKQFGFAASWEEPCMENTSGRNKRLVFCGDEPFGGETSCNAENCDWLMHEAFCLYEERDLFHPYEKCHSTVMDACRLAERLHVKNLILYHTEDTHIRERKKLYLREGQSYYHGKLWIPDDGETITL